MTATARFDKKHAFVLRSTDVRSLWDVLQKRVGTVVAKAACTDSIERTFTSVDDVLKYENPRSRSITRLSFDAKSKDYEISASVEMGSRYSSSIEASARGPEDQVMGLRNALSEVFDGMRPWFAPVARIDFYFVVLALFLFGVFVIQIMAGGTKVQRPTMGLGSAAVAASAVIGFFGALALLVWVLNWLRARFFPPATFALGQGESRYAVDENVRWVVVVGFLVSMFSSLVFAFLWG